MVGRVQALLAAGRAPAQFWRELRVFAPPRQEPLLRAAKATRPRDVEEAIAHAARIDRMVKGLDRGEVWDELLALGMRFATAAPRPRRTQTR
jgi:DNA polymerase-3 subunit delta